MGEKVGATNMNKQRGMVLGVVGLIALILGALIVNVRGMPFRGSGLGTILEIIGVVLLVLAGLLIFMRARE